MTFSDLEGHFRSLKPFMSGREQHVLSEELVKVTGSNVESKSFQTPKRCDKETLLLQYRPLIQNYI